RPAAREIKKSESYAHFSSNRLLLRKKQRSPCPSWMKPRLFHPPFMRIFASVFAALSLLATGAYAQAPAVIGARNVKIEKIQPALITSPQFTITGTKDKRSEYLKWFEIEVEFEIDLVELVDELTLKYD